MNYNRRQKRLRARMQADEITYLLVSENKNRRYLSGFDGSSGWLLLSPSEHYLLTDGRYWDQVARQSPSAKLVRFTADEHETLIGAVVATLDTLPDGRVGMETDGITLATYRDITGVLKKAGRPVQEVEGLVAELRECKDDDEVELLQRAADIADRALCRALEEFGPGRSELELKAAIEYQILLQGGESTSFPTIVASGPNGSYPHAGASSRVVKEGELVTIDFGAVYGGYCSDMTRTIWYGELSNRDRDLLYHVREAQKLALEAVRAGIRACDLDAVARQRLEDAGLAERFVHSLGHGVGLNIHEAPGLRKTNESELKEGQVVTIEPGVYLTGETGCRVEDTVVVTENGCRVLNNFPKQSLDSPAPNTRLASEG